MRRWVIFVAAVVLSLLVLFVIRTQGYVKGTEFAPTHFQTREFSFYEIPFLHLQITPIWRKGTSYPSITYVRQSSLIPIAKGAPTDDQWHLVQISRGLSGTTPADAELLISRFQFYGSSGYWKQWSIDHPKKAAILWPVVQRLAKRELYVLTPLVFEIAQEENDVAKFALQIDRLLQREYLSIVRDMREAGRDKLAEALLDEAVSEYPDSTDLAKLKQAS